LSNDVDKIEETKIGQTYSLFLIVHMQEQLGHLTCDEQCGCDQKQFYMFITFVSSNTLHSLKVELRRKGCCGCQWSRPFGVTTTKRALWST